VLELGCGTGRIVRALAALGIPVTGIDIDPQALAYAAASIPPSSRPYVQLLEADMRVLALNRCFGLILATLNTLASLDDDDLARALHRAHQHLLPDGLFASEVPPPQDVHDDSGEEILTTYFEPSRDNPVQVSARQTAATPRGPLQVEWRYDELLPDGRVARTSFSTTYYLREAGVMIHFLKEAGFTEIEVLGDYDGTPWSPGAPRLIFLARRTPAQPGA
jgi:SAM-dependent methyltransferase